MNKQKDKLIGKLTLHRITDLTPRRREKVASWLRTLAIFVHQGKTIPKRFTASYTIVPRTGRKK